ncbi:MAG: phosphate ABC transporter substrate-binding protein PstS [Halanaerobium sp.]
MFSKKISTILLVALLFVLFSGTALAQVSLESGGASFPYPLYSTWMDVYTENNDDVKIDYQSIGSGGGIRGIIDKTFDFAGSDAPMKDEELESADGDIMHIPTVMGAVAVTYNLEGVDEQLNLKPETIADIYLGKIEKWNDPEIQDANPDVELPDKYIVVVRRSDGSGTTNAFTDFLSKVSGEWEEEVGFGKAVQWPVGMGAKGNEGVAGQVSQNDGSIGYVELAYAIENDLSHAKVRNRDGNYVEASLESTTEAAAGAVEDMPDDMRVSITWQPGENAWPIATFTYLLVYEEYEDEEMAGEMIDYIWWALTEGDDYATELLYSPIPENLEGMVKEKLESITVDGEAVRPDLEH